MSGSEVQNIGHYINTCSKCTMEILELSTERCAESIQGCQ